MDDLDANPSSEPVEEEAMDLDPSADLFGGQAEDAEEVEPQEPADDEEVLEAEEEPLELSDEQVQELSEENRKIYNHYRSQLPNVQAKAKEAAYEQFRKDHATDLEAAEIYRQFTDPNNSDKVRDALLAANPDIQKKLWEYEKLEAERAAAAATVEEKPLITEDDLSDLYSDPTKLQHILETMVEKKVQPLQQRMQQQLEDEKARQEEVRHDARRRELISDWEKVVSETPVAAKFEADVTPLIIGNGLSPEDAFLLAYMKRWKSQGGQLRHVGKGKVAKATPPVPGAVPTDMTGPKVESTGEVDIFEKKTGPAPSLWDKVNSDAEVNEALAADLERYND